MNPVRSRSLRRVARIVAWAIAIVAVAGAAARYWIDLSLTEPRPGRAEGAGPLVVAVDAALPAIALLALATWRRHRVLQILLAVGGIGLATFGIWTAHRAAPTHGQLHDLLHAVDTPAGFTVHAERRVRGDECLPECTHIEREYCSRAADPEPLSKFQAVFAQAGYPLKPESGGLRSDNRCRVIVGVYQPGVRDPASGKRVVTNPRCVFVSMLGHVGDRSP